MRKRASSLKNVSLCAIDCMLPSLAARALERSILNVDFYEALLLSDTSVRTFARIVAIDAIGSRSTYSDFVLRQLSSFVETPYVLIAQWDGYVIDGRTWSDEFLQYDYIGAGWHWFEDGANVGNGGFSLRSRRLIEAVATLCDGISFGDVNEDIVICRILRPELERRFGITFAPTSVANRFSYERTVPLEPTFGFHGLFNFWRHVDDGEVLEIASQCPRSILKGREYIELMIAYLQLSKFSTFSGLFDLCLSAQTASELHQSLLTLTNDSQLANRFMELGARMQRS